VKHGGGGGKGCHDRDPLSHDDQGTNKCSMLKREGNEVEYIAVSVLQRLSNMPS
jgi:hypothetical protein